MKCCLCFGLRIVFASKVYRLYYYPIVCQSKNQQKKNKNVIAVAVYESNSKVNDTQTKMEIKKNTFLFEIRIAEYLSRSTAQWDKNPMNVHCALCILQEIIAFGHMVCTLACGAMNWKICYEYLSGECMTLTKHNVSCPQINKAMKQPKTTK